MRNQVAICCVATLMALSGNPVQASEVLYSHSGGALFDGKFGPIARFQQALDQRLEACNSRDKAAVNGRFGQETATSIKSLLACPEAGSIAADDGARRGKLTDAVWKFVLPNESAPNLDSRVQTLVLTYEATDYTSAEWNYCQNKPFFDAAKTGSKCYSNDLKSFITWGPRGATAGHGREIQSIIWHSCHQRQHFVS